MFRFSSPKSCSLGFFAFFLLYVLISAALQPPTSHFYARVGENSFLVNLFCTPIPFVEGNTVTGHAPLPQRSGKRCRPPP